MNTSHTAGAFSSFLSSSVKRTSLLSYQSYIQGQWQSGAHAFEVRNPANAEVLAQIQGADMQIAEQAIQAAYAAFPAWSALTGKQRAHMMKKWFDLIIQYQEDLAWIMTLEQGKPLTESRNEVTYGASFIEWFAEEAKRVNGDILASTWADKRTLVLKQPIGVCAAITPWNFPLAMITRKIAPAIAAGCTIIIKPAEQTPLTALALAQLAHEAGIPVGVINVVAANAEQSIAIGKLFCEHPHIRHISFTGSTPVGRILMQQSAPTLKKLALELGGHAPFILFEDADLEQAVQGAIQSKYRNAGQTCVCTNRIYVHQSIYSSFLSLYQNEIKKIQVGQGWQESTQQGPLIDDAAILKVQQQVDDALQKGARLLIGGKKHEHGQLFFQPTLLADVQPHMTIMQEETFGPIAAVSVFENEDEVIKLANASEFGLAAYFYSQNLARVWRVAEKLEYGMVGVNAGLLSNEVVPFGGVKQSGFGREGSKYGMDEYLNLKYVCMGGID